MLIFTSNCLALADIDERKGGAHPMTEEINQEEDQNGKLLEEMTVKELREITQEIPEITGVSAMNKEHLLAVIKEARGMKEEEPARESKGKSSKRVVSVKELKQRIASLRAEKAAAQQGKNRKSVNVLRRRIHRLKKRTRKIAHV